MSDVVVAQQRVAPSGFMRTAGAGRNDALDISKGALVVWMLVYHWLNYFVAVDGSFYRYLRPVTPSFIFITGFLVSHIHFARHSPTDARLRARLIGRGVRLLLLFIALNVAVAVVDPTRYALGDTALLGQATAIFLVGSASTAFNILVPIAYFLVLAPLMIRLCVWLGVSFHLITAALLVLATASSQMQWGLGHVELLSFAFLGLSIGSISADALERALAPAWIVVAYVAYTLALTAWDVLFPLQVVGTALSLMLLYLVGLRWRTGEFARGELIRLGQYSLLAYISQIVVLQALEWGLPAGERAAVPALVAALAITWMAIRATAAFRERLRSIDAIYRLVFS